MLAVLAYHQSPERVPGGFLGVSLFFTLSGFLITTIVLREHERSGAVDLKRFWIRRVRRLAPVALAGLLLALGVAAVVTEPSRQAAVGGDAVSAALDVANWRFAGAGVHYGDTLTVPSPVSHYWSLAIEEQFYVVFPVVAALALGRRRGRAWLAAALAAAVALSVARQLTLTDTNRIYLGTDTRAAELAIGAVAAVAWAGRCGERLRRRPRVLDAAGAVALGALATAWLSVRLADHRLWRGGVEAHAVLAVALVLACVGGRIGPALGRVRPLVALGAISYAVYVVHFPLFLLLTAGRTHLDGAALVALRFGASIGLALLLRVAIEQPVRIGGALPRRALLAYATAVAAVALVAFALPHVGPSRPAAAAELEGQGITVATMAAPPPTTATTLPPPRVHDPDVVLTGAAPPVARVPRLLVVGDSTAAAFGYGMQVWAERTGEASVSFVAAPACTTLHEGEIVFRSGWTQPTTDECRALPATAAHEAEALDVDAVIVLIGSMQLSNWNLPGDRGPSHVGQPAWDLRYVDATRAWLATVEQPGVPVLWADLPTPAWRPMGPAGPAPGRGRPYMDDADRAAALMALDREVLGGDPQAQPWAFTAAIAGPDGRIPDERRPDGLHVGWDQVGGLLDAGMFAGIHACVDAVVARTGSGSDALLWSA